VVIADDHVLYRRGLQLVMSHEDGIDIVGEAADGEEAVAKAIELVPDVVLMDVRMPRTSGIQACQQITEQVPSARILMLTMSDDEADLFEAVKSGAQGYLPKDLEAERLFTLLDGVTRGEPALTPGLARKLLGEFARPPVRAERSPQALTEREREVLELLVQGVTSNRELAERLFVTENTVKYHLRNILDKLHLQNRAQVIAYALRHGLVAPSHAGPI